MPQYMLLIYNPVDSELTPEELQETGSRFDAYPQGLQAAGVLVGDRVATTQREHVCGQCRHCRSGHEPLCVEQVFLGDTRLNGGYAEFVAVDADNVVPVPDDVTLDAAAIASCAIGTMLHAVRAIGCVAPGDTVLVTGAGGGLGMHGVQLAKRAGGRVIAQTTSAGKVAMLRELGADAVVHVVRGTTSLPRSSR